MDVASINSILDRNASSGVEQIPTLLSRSQDLHRTPHLDTTQMTVPSEQKDGGLAILAQVMGPLSERM